MEWDPLPETVCRMAGILLLQNLHFHRPWWSERHPSVHGRIYSESQAAGPNSCLGLELPLSMPATSACLDNFFFVNGTAVTLNN